MRRETSRWRKALRLAAPFAAAVMVLALPLVAGAQEGPPGNNGTVKVDGVPFDDHPDNEPHPGCTFEIDWYNFDANATSDVTFETQNPTGVSLLLEDTVTLDGDPNEGGDEDGLDGHREYTLDFTEDDFYHPQQGYHVKLTIETTWPNGADAKHKVFWVSECEAPLSPSSSVSPTGSVSVSPSGSVSVSESVSESVSVSVSGSVSISPSGGTSTTQGPTAGGISGSNSSGPTAGGTAFAGAEDASWLIAATIGLLVAGTLVLRMASARSESAGEGDRTA